MVHFSSFQLSTESLSLNSQCQRDLMTSHLLSLSPESRRNRFCSETSDESILKYIASLNPTLDYMFGILSPTSILIPSQILALGHLGRVGNSSPSHYELALSVAESDRQKGLGSSLLEDILFNRAPNLGVQTISCHCLYTNRKVQELFVRKGVTLKTHYSDNSSIGRIEIPEPSTLSRCSSRVLQLIELNRKLTRTSVSTLRFLYS